MQDIAANHITMGADFDVASASEHAIVGWKVLSFLNREDGLAAADAAPILPNPFCNQTRLFMIKITNEHAVAGNSDFVDISPWELRN